VAATPAVVELLRALRPVLNGFGSWYLFGAQAVTILGVPRLSADVDVTLKLDKDAPADLLQALRTAGFTPRIEDPEFVRRTRVLPLVHQATGMPLDIVLAGSGLEDEFLARARVVDVGGVEVPVISAEDLVIAKVLAGRPKDLEDARGVVRVQGKGLDAARIEQILGLLEDALGQSDLLPTWHALRGSSG
jgi:hypothetical protein